MRGLLPPPPSLLLPPAVFWVLFDHKPPFVIQAVLKENFLISISSSENTMSISATEFLEENAGGSDSDTNLDESPEAYQPLSAGDSSDSDSDPNQLNSDEDHGNHSSNHHRLPNGYIHHHAAENGISSLDLNDDDLIDDVDDEEEEETSESAILRAFREDESRRNAPLAPENATRVIEAMRGVSFGGVAPDWLSQVPEDRWIDQLRRLRQMLPPQSTSPIQP